MQTGLDRRTFLARAAVASGGLMEHGGARAPRHACTCSRTGTGLSRMGRCAARKTSEGSRCSRSPPGSNYVTFSHTGSTMSDGSPTPLALDGMGRVRQPEAPRPRPTVMATGTTTTSSGSCATARTAPGRQRPAACPGDRTKAYDPTGYGGTSTLVSRRAQATTRRGLREPQRHGRQLRGRDRVSPPLLGSRARKPSAGRKPPTPMPALPDGHRPLSSQMPVHRARQASSNPAAHRSPRRAVSHTVKRRPWTSERASSTRPRTRALEVSAPARTATRRTTRTTSTRGGSLPPARHHGPSERGPPARPDPWRAPAGRAG